MTNSAPMTTMAGYVAEDLLTSSEAPDDDLERLLAGVEAAFATPGLSPAAARRISALANDAAAAIRRRRDRAAIRRLTEERDAHRAFAGRLAETLRRYKRTYSEALSAARSGVFECRLADERLEWTSGVYDMFGFPPGARLHRRDTVGVFAPASLAALERFRAQAIATGAGFECDAEIESAQGERRWIRISAKVERRNGASVRLFGMKQDVTEAKSLAEETRRLAESDPLTGLAGRRVFERRLSQIEDGALLLVDLDGFKQINDTFGHAFGDQCLKVAGARLRVAARGADLVARIGGDEFALLMTPAPARNGVERAARAVVEALSIPIEHGGVRLMLGASVGLAHAGACTPSELFARADAALYAAKAAGRGTFRSYVEGQPVSREERSLPVSASGR